MEEFEIFLSWTYPRNSSFDSLCRYFIATHVTKCLPTFRVFIVVWKIRRKVGGGHRWCSGTAHERDFPSELYSGPWKIRAMNGSPSCTGRIRRFALSCILDERRRAEGRKEDTRDMKFWSQVYVGSGIGSYPDPVAARCERMRENLVCQRVNCPIPD